MGSWARFLPVAFLLATTAVILQARYRKESLPPHPDLSSFPRQIEDRRGMDVPFTTEELQVLGPGEFLLRNYLAGGQPMVNLYIAYFPSQRSGDTIHSPKNCLPGSGWAPLQSGSLSIERADGTAMSVNRYIVANGDNRDLVLYWYQSHGRVVASEYSAKFFLVSDAIRLNRTDGALVRVLTPIANAQDNGPAQARALQFVHAILPLLDNYIPR